MLSSLQNQLTFFLIILVTIFISACSTIPAKQPIQDSVQRSSLMPDEFTFDPQRAKHWKEKIIHYQTANPKTVLVPYSRIIGEIEALPDAEECAPHALELANKALELNPTSILALYMQMRCLTDPVAKASQRQKILEISNVLLGTGSGKHRGSAIEVRELAEAYALLSVLGWYIYDMETVINRNEELLYRFHSTSFEKNEFRFFYFQNMALLKRLYSAKTVMPLSNRTASIVTMRNFLEARDPAGLAYMSRNLMAKQEYSEVVEQLQPHYERSLVLSALLAEALIKLDRYEDVSPVIENLELESDGGFVEGMLIQALLISSIHDSDEAYEQIDYLLQKVDYLTEPDNGIHLFLRKLAGHPKRISIIKNLLDKYVKSETIVSAILALANELNYYEHHAEQILILELLIEEGINNPEVLFELGKVYRHGRGVEADPQKALTLYQQAAEAGLAPAQVDLGFFYIQGMLGLKADITVAEHWFTQAAEQNHPKAWHNLAELNSYLGTEESISKAIEYYHNAMNSGSPDSICNLGLLYRDNEQVKDLPKSIETLKQGANKGYMDCLFDLAYTYEVYIQDYSVSRQWYEKAAALGNSAALSNLGRFYHRGLGVKQDFSQAKEYYEAAIKEGNSYANVNLGLMYEEGQGVEQNFATAAELYQTAAQDGNAQALHNLGVMYAEGRHFPKDLEQALEYYQKAAKRGNKYSLFNVGNAYRYGRGTAKDMAIALQYYYQAMLAGVDDAICQLASLYEAHPEFKDPDKSNKYHRLAKEKGLPECEKISFIKMAGEGLEEQLVEISGDTNLHNLISTINHADVVIETDIIGENASEDVKLKQLKKQAESEQYNVASFIGEHYYYGIVLEQNYQKSSKYMQQAFQEGDEIAAYILGEIYYQGLLNKNDYNKAFEYFNIGHKRGSPLATFGLSRAYFYGFGVSQSNADAFKYANQAANKKVPEAMLWLARFYKQGTGTPINQSKAEYWYEEAIKANSIEAAFEFGVMLLQGKEVRQDTNRGMKLIKRCASEKFEPAIEYLNQVQMPKR